jgi:hypothetical protein
MPKSGKNRQWLLAAVLAGVLATAIGVGWINRAPLMAWYAVRGLAGAHADDRAKWTPMIEKLDWDAVDALLDGLRASDPESCANLQAGVAALVEHWPSGDLRRPQLAKRLAETFPSLSAAGQCTALELHSLLLQLTDEVTDPQLSPATAAIVARVAVARNSQANALALATAERLRGKWNTSPELVTAIRELVRACFADPDQSNRLRAIHLARNPAIDLLGEAVVLLNDPYAEVRAGAMLGVGTSEAAISTDDLLHWLHDPDREVRRLCEKALRTRGLEDLHLRLGRMITDARAGTRLEVFELLRAAQDLDESVWLRRLSHDASAAVRAAAVRAAAEQGLANLADRLQQMSQNDPSATVRQLAQFYAVSGR